MALGRHRRIATFVALALSAPAIGVAAVVATATPAAAAVRTITVTVADDTNNSGTGGCSLREAIAVANAGSQGLYTECTIAGASGAFTIVFNLTGPCPCTITRTDPGELDVIVDGVTIQGPNPGSHTDVVVDGNGSPIFGVQANLTFTVKDLTIQNASSSQPGAAIRASTGGTINATDVLFHADTTSPNGGGAISSQSAVNVTDSTFTNNAAVFSTGGAIDAGPGAITIANSDFSNNNANGGGAVHGGTITITGDSDFTDNTANASGGAAVFSTGSVSINGTSDFTNNDSSTGSAGGAIVATSVTISGGADFTNNDNAGGGGRGGCVNAASITVNAGGDGSAFTNNTAGTEGGCFFTDSGSVAVTGATFTKNASASGGAIYTNSGTVTVTNSVFGGSTVADGNTASGGGGAISNNGAAAVSTTGSTFQHNTAGNNGGGAIASGGPFTATGSTFDHNSTTGTGSGGAVADETVTISSSTFSANTAAGSGGALNAGNGSIANSTFEANSTTGASSTGSAFFIGDATTTLTNITVADSNSVNASAGAVEVGSLVTMASSIVANTTGGKNCVGMFNAGGFDMESLTGSTGSTCPSGGTNLPDADPQLGALTVNAPGTTATMAPVTVAGTASPAVDAVTSGCPPPATDQRGVNRPQGARCDVGAVEVEQGLFSSLVPARILDTRGATGGHPGALGPGQTFNLQVLGQGGVPAAGVTTVVMNITAVGPTAGGWVTAFPSDASLPLAASVNFAPGQTIGNLVTVKVGADGKVSLNNANGFVHLVADVVGYYGVAGDSRLTPLVPGRILDTRGATGGHPGPLGPGGTLDLQVTGQGGVPASGVTGVVMNVTAVGPTAGGWLTAWPTGVTQPLAASVNFDPGETIGNLVKLKLGTGGKVSLFNANGFAHVVVDVVGWYGPAGDSRVVPVVPGRILDTRGATGGHPGAVAPGESFDLVVQGHGGVPLAGATAVVVNITAVSPSAGGFVTAWPTGTSMPLASTINFAAGQVIGHLAVLKLGTGGKVSFFNANGFVQLVVDVVGWYGNP